MSLVTLNKEMNDKLTIVNLPKVSLYFSYEKLISFVYSFNNKKKLFINEYSPNYSDTTSKHIEKIKQLNDLRPIWKTEEQFNKLLETIFKP